jgi:hypothetical protein
MTKTNPSRKAGLDALRAVVFLAGGDGGRRIA